MSVLLTVIGMSLTFFLTYFFTIRDGGIFHDFWYNYHTFGVLLSAIGIFSMCKHYLSKIKLGGFFNSLNRLSFGIYLVHILVMWIFADSVINPSSSSVPSHRIHSFDRDLCCHCQQLGYSNHQQNSYSKQN